MTEYRCDCGCREDEIHDLVATSGLVPERLVTEVEIANGVYGADVDLPMGTAIEVTYPEDTNCLGQRIPETSHAEVVGPRGYYRDRRQVQRVVGAYITVSALAEPG